MALFQDFAGSLSQFMEPAMNRFAEGLLGQIATDYQLDLDEMVAKYLDKAGDSKWAPKGVTGPGHRDILDLNPNPGEAEKEKEKEKEKPTRAPRRKKSPAGAAAAAPVMCEGLTAKGTACKNKAKPDECLCHIHLKKKAKDESGEPPAARKPKKAKKVEPVHTHLVGEEPESETPCAVCESHGDVAVAEDDEAAFEVDDDIKSRLAAILAGVEDESEDDEDEDEDEEEEIEEEEIEEESSPVGLAHAAKTWASVAAESEVEIEIEEEDEE
jgi:hypothetical protein